jgi:hypothetical protein
MSALNIISLGAGVQSSTMALMAACGEITPMPDCAIFADTQAEPEKVYQWVDFLETKLPFPIYRVTAGNLLENVLKNKTLSGHDFQDVPWRTIGGMGRRQCTTQYKIIPIQKKLRELGAKASNPFVLWIGISTDEAQRMKPARKKYYKHIFPLIDKNMTRLHCLRWLSENNYPKPMKSSCVFCPYKGNAEWRELDERDLAIAVNVDKAIRTFGVMQYAHRYCKPLDQVDFRSAEDAGQLSMFGEECEGMCGV